VGQAKSAKAGDETAKANELYYGDNLKILREHIKDESVDLIYLDPPFNSNANYNAFFKGPTGEDSRAQIEAFEDTWHWTHEAEQSFDSVMTSRSTDAAGLLRSMRAFLSESDMMAYLTMMTVRLLELRRVLKPAGSLYLHCDPTASHYLKLVLDSIFGIRNFRNEITWKRRVGTSSAVHESTRFGTCTDILLFYSKSEEAEFHPQYNKDTPEYKAYVEERFNLVDENGRRFQADNLTNPAFRPNLIYEYKGYKPPRNGWAICKEKMEQWDKEGRIYFPKSKNARLRRKRFADELKGMPVQNLWTDIAELNSQAQERLRYPTQKPVALLERIIQASSNEGDVVLDAFCGCGTSIHAAQKLNRQWIGIDITHLAIRLIETRLKAFSGLNYRTHGVPKDLEGARDLAARDKHEFQLWATAQVEAVPYKSGQKGADGGVDGVITFRPDAKQAETAIVSVKGGQNVGVHMIRELAHVVKRDRAQVGILITLTEPTGPMKAEAVKEGFYETAFGRHPRLQIITVAELFKGQMPNLPPRDSSIFRKPPKVATSKQLPLGIGAAS
jgi:site-specific DNA-methyltransferase (adenine-specific)